MKLEEVAEYTKGDDPAEQAYAAIEDAKGEEPAADAEPAAPGGRGRVKIPELAGLPMRAALKVVLETGLVPLVEGTGVLLRTEPPEGSKVQKGSDLVLVFEPQT
jgi:cell division protein FtsI (penicillin-binding protein 3)